MGESLRNTVYVVNGIPSIGRRILRSRQEMLLATGEGGHMWIVAVLAVCVILIVLATSKKGAARKASSDGKFFEIVGNGKFAVEVVGESHYQPALLSIVAPKTGRLEHTCEASLICESDNRYDKNAVRVDVDSKTVGYLPRLSAVAYRQAIAEKGAALAEGRCRARIYGGGAETPSYGIWLDMV